LEIVGPIHFPHEAENQELLELSSSFILIFPFWACVLWHALGFVGLPGLIVMADPFFLPSFGGDGRRSRERER